MGVCATIDDAAVWLAQWLIRRRGRLRHEMGHHCLLSLLSAAILLFGGLRAAHAGGWSSAAEWATKKAAPFLVQKMLDAGMALGIEETARALLKRYRGPTDAEEQYKLGLAYLNGLGVDRDEAQAAAWFTKSAEQDFAKAQLELARLYYTNGEHARSVPLVRRAALQGLAGAQSQLGYDYLYGDGVASDLWEAEKWLAMAADQRDYYGMYYLIEVYNQRKDFVKRNGWVRVLAEQGNHHFENLLGAAYANGEGFSEPNPQNAVFWFERAAAGNDRDGKFNLAQAYEEGFGGLPRDLARAFNLYLDSSDHGDGEASAALQRLCQSDKFHDQFTCMIQRGTRDN